jgi:hypothetical protein
MRNFSHMPLTLLISKHRVMLTITGVYLSVTLVGALVGLTIALNDLARILVEIQEVVSTHSETISNT